MPEHSVAKSMDILAILQANLNDRDPLWRFPEEKKESRLSELAGLGARFKYQFSRSGISKGDRIGILLENSSAYTPTLLALWSLEAIVVPLRPFTQSFTEFDAYLSAIHQASSLKALIVDDLSNCPPITSWAIRAQVLCLDLAQIRNDDLPEKMNHHISWLELSSPGANPDDTAIIQYSSGSTGNPKGVVVTHGMMLAQLGQIKTEMFSNCRGLVIRSSASWLPYSHDMGLFIGILNPIFAGADNLLASPRFYMMNPRRWFQLLAQFHVQLNFTTNTALSGALRAMKKMEPIDLSALYLCIGAEKIHAPQLREAYRILGQFNMTLANFRVGYGMAENTLGASSTTGAQIEVHRFHIDPNGQVTLAETNWEGTVDSQKPVSMEIVSIGKPHQGTSIQICDEHGQELPELQIGEIVISGPCVMKGYYNAPEATLRALDGRRLRTRDLGFKYRDEFYFHSRADDLLIVGGQNIVPDDVEAKVEELDFIRPTGSVLIGLQRSPSAETELVLLVELKENGPNTGTGSTGESDLDLQRKQIQKKAFEACRVLIPNILFCEPGTVETTSSGKKRRKVIASKVRLPVKE